MNYLAIDLGAESGRVMLGTVEASRIRLDEFHRFPNTPIREGESLRWNLDAIWTGIIDGLKRAGEMLARQGKRADSISVDSWGVDYVLLDARGNIQKPAFHYRDPRARIGSKQFLAALPWEQIFAETGIQYMPINTLFQLASEPPERFARATRLLSVADCFNFALGGAARIEVSMASTFQLYNPQTRAWSQPILQKLEQRGFHRELLPGIVPSGTELGVLAESLNLPASLRGTKIIATCSHDTGAAVAATPLEPGAHAAYLSSGTWSLMGVERSEPIINDLARELNFTNEIGFGHTVRLLKNISGLWLLQECRRAWSRDGRDLSYAELTQLAAAQTPFRSIINPADPRFLAPDDMPRAISDFCRETGQPGPETPAAFTRCIFESLAALYRHTLDQLDQLTGHPIELLHIVGGGSRNQLLNQLTADACAIPVLAGPVEATALGNILIQAITLHEIPHLASARNLISRALPPIRFEPKAFNNWRSSHEKFRALVDVRRQR